MKKITLSMVAMASLVTANGDINPLVTKVLEKNPIKKEAKSNFFNKVHAKGDMRLRH
jgi:hypothetical protein